MILRKLKPELFRKQPYHLHGCDMQVHCTCANSPFREVHIFRIILFTLFLFLFSIPAQLHADLLARAEVLIGDGRYSDGLKQLEGYQPASKMTEQRALWARGLAHVKLGQPSAALPFLERLVALAPQNSKYRLELSVALGQLGQTERALYHIELARGSGLPPNVDQQVAAYAQALENPKIVSGHLSFAIVPETNAAKRTSATGLELFGLPFVLDPSARAQSATGIEISSGVVASPLLAPGWRAQVGVSTQLIFFGGAVPNDYFGRLYAEIIHGHLETGQTNAQVFTTQRFLDDKKYSQSSGLTLSHARRLTPSTRVDGLLLFEDTNYLSGQEIRRIFVSAGSTHLVHSQLQLSFGARMEQRSSDTETLAGTLLGVSVGAKYRFQGGVQVALNLDYEKNRFDGVSPTFQISRNDNRTTARFEVSNSHWNWKGFAPVMDITAERQSSTIIINEFNNFGASFGITRRF